MRVGGRQQACSKPCATARRREQARRRRGEALEECRAAERARQSAWRAARAALSAGAPATAAAEQGVEATPTGPPVTCPVSRAEFGAQEPEIRQQLLAFWDQQARLSRAEFARKIRGFIGSPGALVGSPGP